MSKRVLLVRCALLSTVAMFGSGCSTLEGLKTIGNPPPLSPVSDPTTQPGYTPVQMPRSVTF
jgi:flagellar L-ring protein FlgH